MTTRKKIIIAIIVIGALALITWFIYKNKKEVITKEELPSTSFPLKMGSSGKEVENLQNYLNDKYGAGLEVDGMWGWKTDSAVMQFLKRDNISEAVYLKWSL